MADDPYRYVLDQINADIDEGKLKPGITMAQHIRKFGWGGGETAEAADQIAQILDYAQGDTEMMIEQLTGEINWLKERVKGLHGVLDHRHQIGGVWTSKPE